MKTPVKIGAIYRLRRSLVDRKLLKMKDKNTGVFTSIHKGVYRIENVKMDEVRFWRN